MFAPLISTNVSTDSTVPNPESIYLGCNSETIFCKESFRIPRTMYHLFFIYFALKERHQSVIHKRYPLIFEEEEGLLVKDKHELSNLEKHKIVYEKSTESLHEDISQLFVRKYIRGKSCSWRQIAFLIEDIWNSFAHFEKFPKGRFHDHLIHNFYAFIYRPIHLIEGNQKAKKILIKAIAREWTSASGQTLIYRSGLLDKDNIIHPNGTSQRLTFASSPLAGIIFDTGACPLFNQIFGENRSLYALSLTDSKLKKYFFVPQPNTGLYPMMTKGEHSHQRLRFFPSSSLKQEDVSEAAFDSKMKASVASQAAYYFKIKSIFTRHFILLDQSTPVAKL